MHASDPGRQFDLDQLNGNEIAFPQYPLSALFHQSHHNELESIAPNQIP
jgi:hypothetical protein